MNKPLKTKLCWNCEGSVSRTLENCPYCGVYLSPEAADIQEDSEDEVPLPKRSVATKKSKTGSNEQEDPLSIPKAPYIPRDSEESAFTGKESSKGQAYSIESSLDPRQFSLFRAVYLPVLLLSTGAICLLFSLILLAFATDGKLTLQWEQDLWPVFAILALPLLFFGWRNIASDDS